VPPASYYDSINFLYSLGNELKTAKLGLDRISVLLARLGNPHRRFRVVHVAGTNGKGSTCAMIESGLRAAGVRTALFTSPHLAEPTERIQVAGQPIRPDAFAEVFRGVNAAAEELLRAGDLDAHPSYFETVTAMGFLYFARQHVDTAVVEVGLGGSLDATNVVTPELSVITPIDFDHENFLGASLTGIATEKAGILKRGSRGVLAWQRPEVETILRHRAAHLDVPVTSTSEYAVKNLALYESGSVFVAAKDRPISIRCPLAGEHQVQNALAAVAALETLETPVTAIENGIAATRWPGRLEMVARNPDILLDGAHNPAGARALACYLERFYSARRVTLIYGAMRDKAVEEILEILSPIAHNLILTAPHFERAVRPEALCDLLAHPRAGVAPDLTAALSLARETSGVDLILITGSLYLVGEARALLVK